MKRAFISVYDKTGLAELARFLTGHDWEIVSTGGTAKALEAAGAPVISVEEVTGQPSIMDGRVKTLDFRVFGPILFDRDKAQHKQDLANLGQAPVDLVVVNLYPFAEMLAKDLSRAELVEYIDIGGPSLLRAAAKNWKHVTVMCSPDQYPAFMAAYRENEGRFSEDYRNSLAGDVFRLTSRYDGLVADFFDTHPATGALPARLQIAAGLVHTLRYGENPHQQAGYYLSRGATLPWEQLHGKELSYNNYTDLEAAIQIAGGFEEPAAAIIKHANPCGFGTGATVDEAYRRALSTDPMSSFGGIVALNRPVDSVVANRLADIFLECIVAPDFEAGAYDRLAKKKNLRLLKLNPVRTAAGGLTIRSTAGGYLVQEDDAWQGEDGWEVVTSREPDEDENRALRLGWKLVRFVKSNAIVFCNFAQLLGVGAGQMSRVDSVILAGRKAADANLDLAGAAMASDAFFPFPDGLEAAAELGIKAVIQPGGSVRDTEVIAAANLHGVAMIFTHKRHFRH